MKRHRIPVAFEEGLAVACLALLVVITLLNVVTRYLTSQSYAWTEEISIFLMVVMTLAGASAAAARDGHIRIEFFYDGGSAARRRALRIVAACVTGLVFAALALLFARTVADEIRYGETTMGLGVPRWWYTLVVPALCAGLALRAFGRGWAAARQVDGADARQVGVAADAAQVSRAADTASGAQR
ncbi:MAG: TRAP transporter small permease [Ideonella sp.]|nr:TRAP transporter small permease [Ideonella sp.]MCC7458640.1 TRAP transporter small permease [Nitrospira sp.]